MPLYLNNKTLSDYEQLVTMSENNRLEQAQAQVREVTDVMRVNVDKVLERDSKLSDLNSRADNLQAGANQFQTRVGFILTLTCHHTINMCLSSGNETAEEVLVAEYEDDDDHWCGRPHPPDHHHCLGH